MAVKLHTIFFGLPAIAVYVLLLSPLLTAEMSRESLPQLLGSMAVLAGFLWIIHRCIRRLSQNDMPPPDTENVAAFLSYHMVQHLSTKKEVTPETMLQAATESKRGLFVLGLIGIERDEMLRAWKEGHAKMDTATVIRWGMDARKELGIPRLDSTAMIYAYCKNVPELETLLHAADLSIQDVQSILKAEAFHFYWTEQHKNPLSPEAIVQSLGALGKSWVVGYNTELERLTTNLSATIFNDARDTVIHTESVASIFRAFAGGGHNNVLIVGKPGSGRRTLARNVARALRKSELEQGIGFTDVLMLRTSELLSGAARGDMELLSAMKKAAMGGKFIMVISDLTLLLEAADEKLKQVLMAMLESKNLRTIGIVETAEYHERIKPDPALDAMFEKILLSDSTESETMSVLLEEYFILERKRSVRITYKALKSIVELCKRFINKEALPGKAIDIMREAVAHAKSTNSGVVTDALIREIISVQARVDVRQLTENDRVKLLELEPRMARRIIGQPDALKSITDALKRAKMDVGSKKRPMGTFLFLGTTGVGKTETAKVLAEEYFGNAESFIRVDMNECSEESSIRTLIGGAGSDAFVEGYLTKRIQDRPFSLLLLDEIEKAHPKVLHLFLQILDEGTLLDGNGIATDFRNTIIIATSNAGGRWIAEHEMPKNAAEKQQYKTALLDKILDEHAFSPEFVNRFDDIILFKSLSPADVEKIAILMLDDIVRNISQKRGIRITVEPHVIQILVKRGYNKDFGARELRRNITKIVETHLAEIFLERDMRRGDEIVIRASDMKE